MTKIKFCGLSRPCDIEFSNELKPDYIGFVFFEKSRRYVTPEKALELKKILSPEIKAVGVFVDEKIENILALDNVIDLIQLHGHEDENYINKLRTLTDKIIIKALRFNPSVSFHSTPSLKRDGMCANYLLLDSGEGSGKIFDWKLAEKISRPYFLAGGLNPENVSEAIKILNPFAVDVSSGIETNGFKDKIKMSDFIKAVRKENLQ